MAATIVNTPNLKLDLEWDFSDLGTMVYLLIEVVPVFNKQPDKVPINITLLNLKTINLVLLLKHTLNLDYLTHLLSPKKMQLWLPSSV